MTIEISNKAVSPLEDKIFRSIYLRKKLGCGVVKVKGIRGRPLVLKQIRNPEKPSNQASTRTNRDRAKIIDDIIKRYTLKTMIM